MFHCILLCTPANLTFIRDFFWKHSDICEGLIAPFTIFISCWCLTFHVHLFPGVNEFTLYLVSVSDMFSFIFFFCFDLLYQSWSLHSMYVDAKKDNHKRICQFPKLFKTCLTNQTFDSY